MHGLGDRLVDHDGVLRRAEHAVVEGLAGDDVAHGLLHVRGALDERRRVARADAVRRLAGAVGGSHQAHAAGRQNHRDVAVLHQLLRALERDRRHPVDGAGWRAGSPRRFLHDLGDARDALDRRGMRAEDDRAARLDGDQDLVDGRRRRVRRGHDGRDHAERLGDLDDAAVLVAGDDARPSSSGRMNS